MGSLFLLAYLATTALAASLVKYPSVPLPLKPLFDNQGASASGAGNFDGSGSSYDSQFLPTGPWSYGGISYDLPSTWGTDKDNVVANGQVLTLEAPVFAQELHFVYSGDASSTEFVANFVLGFADNSTQVVQSEYPFANWWTWPGLNNGVIQTPYHFEKNGSRKNLNSTQIHQWSTSVLSEQALTSITLPKNTKPKLHLFAMSLTPSTTPAPDIDTQAPSLSVRQTRFTSRWEMINGVRAQAVEVTLANLLPAYTLSPATSVNTRLVISISGAGIETVMPGAVFRLVPGDQVRVDVFVTGSQADGVASVHVQDANGVDWGTSDGWPTTKLVENWTDDPELLRTHETPTWAPRRNYAEWYNWDVHVPNSATWNHHVQAFGKNVRYDDFIPKFTASKFNASAWVDFFDRAGAKYFVLVTKHHDGFALFDTKNTTQRSSVYLGPKRDFVAELLATAKKEKPELHRGTYYSLPEWFNPDQGPHGFGVWPGGLPRNPANPSELEEYTGRTPINGYIDDLQYPQMLDLALTYDTEIMWCDVGGPNRTPEFAAQFYNHAMAQGRQVTINNRCGAVPDFDTPEYATFGTTQPSSWESNEGMDPFSFGLNSATQPGQYKTASTIVQNLVDIVSKNGN
ncbi:hypothetical protein H0H81_008129 [Sphagnurus paluster]|uniref:alpha-L-fucosidase n=1 Tax=Sphagnurus paluster TaxID=117069 RepID=A0A9P7K4S5_9AGAR|nr:hypothetical protein H0H81_008129 [Sphagnurus paluster]